MLKRYRILIPLLRDSDKKPHHNDAWEELEASLIGQFGGFTVECDVRGVWQDVRGELVRDESRPYVVAIPPEYKQALLDIVDDCREHFDQQCIYLEHPCGSVELR